jgi:hypothetical protein
MEQAFVGEARLLQAALRLFINTGIVVRQHFWRRLLAIKRRSVYVPPQVGWQVVGKP